MARSPNFLQAGERKHAIGEDPRLLEVREVPSILDRLEARAGNRGAERAAVALAQDAVLPAPEKERRDADAVQPALELGVVHVGLPGEARERFAVARGRD